MAIKIRKGQISDLEQVLELIRELAEYEKSPDEVDVNLAELENDFTTNPPAFHLLVAESDEGLAGIALFYYVYSTWKGKALYLEDLVVRESMRRKGVGSQLFEAVIAEAKQHSVRRMGWQVLEWNEPAIEFYKRYQAELDPEWINGKFRKNQIQQFEFNK